jgi:A/G-specific adenine glycosylase
MIQKRNARVKSAMSSGQDRDSSVVPLNRCSRPVNADSVTRNRVDPETFAKPLLAWYDENRRDLPWRQNRDPYRVWLSEIMLQQTRVAAVLEHYLRFLKKFPNVQRLAAARESSVLATWSGLGYYRRARMLHSAAKTVVQKYAGTFPDSSEKLRELPGIGRYTAAAIASIAYDEPVAVVDGNVERVLRRFVGEQVQDKQVQGAHVRGEEVWRIAEGLLDHRRPGDFNQAMMELGATVCLPRQPRCLLCPVKALCVSRGELKIERTAPRQRKRTVHLSLARRRGQVFLVRRGQHESIMPGMWELPTCLGAKSNRKTLFSLRHSITFTNYVVHVYEASNPRTTVGRWFPTSRLESLPLTGLARKVLRAAGELDTD